jgi:hypothetical protein
MILGLESLASYGCKAVQAPSRGNLSPGPLGQDSLKRKAGFGPGGAVGAGIQSGAASTCFYGLCKDIVDRDDGAQGD